MNWEALMARPSSSPMLFGTPGGDPNAYTSTRKQVRNMGIVATCVAAGVGAVGGVLAANKGSRIRAGIGAGLGAALGGLVFSYAVYRWA